MTVRVAEGPATGEARAPIRILPAGVAARIAAGEVIERPASVIKELVENALDAGARTVEVTVRGGGIELMRVRDDGGGIPASELADAFERHATSKLRSEQELFAVRTLGFRGEALAAIAAAADVDLVTRPAHEAAAAVARARGGRIEHLGSAGAAPGTSVEVRELFAALPARRRFLRAPAAEARAITQAVEAYALAYPHVAFRLQVDERRVLATDGGGDLRVAFAALYGVGLAQPLLAVEYERAATDADGDAPSARVAGLVGPPHVHRASRRALTLFANGRAIVSRALAHAVEEAYAGLLPAGRYPVGLLHVHVPPDQIDVNVHPTKAEVRFRHERLVYSAVGAAVRAALSSASAAVAPAPADVAAGPGGHAPWADGRAVVAAARSAPLVIPAAPHSASGPPSAAEPPPAVQSALPLAARLPALRALGQLDATYLVAEAPDGLCLVDQHAAHERVLYEAVLAGRAAGQVAMQPLLQAAVAPLSASQAALAAEQHDALIGLGFAFEPTDGAAVLVRGLPATLAARAGTSIDAARALVDYLDRLAAEEERAGSDRAAATLACRAAVMAGDRLDLEQQRGLLRALEACDAPQTCPHGRPTMLHLSSDALARSFGRR
jgi:DNA mismatch repair protein MutL